MERQFASHVEWHPEAAQYFCRGCNTIFRDRAQVDPHVSDCEKLLEPAEREMIARMKAKYKGAA